MALIHLFRNCNQRCVFCSYPAEQRDKDDRAGLKTWLKELSRMKPGLVQLSGGETLLAPVPDLLKLIAWCSRKGNRVELQTNGVLFPGLKPSDRALLASALNSAGGSFNVNFPAHTAAADLKITRTRGAFASRVRAVAQMIKLGCDVRLTHVLSASNYRSARDFALFAARRYGRAVRIQFSFIKGIGRADGPALIPRYSQAAPFLLEALDLCRHKGLKCEVDHIPPCFLGPHRAASVDISKMRSRTPGPHLEEKKKVRECRGCRLTKLCPGPRKDYIAVHGGL